MKSYRERPANLDHPTQGANHVDEDILDQKVAIPVELCLNCRCVFVVFKSLSFKKKICSKGNDPHPITGQNPVAFSHFFF